MSMTRVSPASSQSSRSVGPAQDTHESGPDSLAQILSKEWSPTNSISSGETPSPVPDAPSLWGRAFASSSG